jgi:hypothetical protein
MARNAEDYWFQQEEAQLLARRQHEEMLSRRSSDTRPKADAGTVAETAVSTDRTDDRERGLLRHSSSQSRSRTDASSSLDGASMSTDMTQVHEQYEELLRRMRHLHDEITGVAQFLSQSGATTSVPTEPADASEEAERPRDQRDEKSTTDRVLWVLMVASAYLVLGLLVLALVVWLRTS